MQAKIALLSWFKVWLPFKFLCNSSFPRTKFLYRNSKKLGEKLLTAFYRDFWGSVIKLNLLLVEFDISFVLKFIGITAGKRAKQRVLGPPGQNFPGKPILITLLSLSKITDLRSSFLIFIPKNPGKELAISKTTESTSVAAYLDLLFAGEENNKITAKLN